MRKITLLMGLLVAGSVACGESTDTVVDDVSGDVTEVIESKWITNYEPHKEKRGNVTILWLKGTPYEMGRQHAELMKDELVAGVEYIDNSILGYLEPIALEYGFVDDAKIQSYQMVLDECQGMADVAGDIGWTFERCLTLAYGEIVLDYLNAGMLQCSQFAVGGTATVDGELIHGRNLDWDEIEYLLDYPTIIVRHPTGMIPYAIVGFPGNVATYNGINAAGITIASNENDSTELDREGRPSIQTQNHILATAETLDDAMNTIETMDRMSAENIMITDGDAGRAVVYQLTATNYAKWMLESDGAVYMTNHYTLPEMIAHGDVPGDDASTRVRYARLEELLSPDSEDNLLGEIDVETAVSILRDRYNPLTGETQEAGTFDNDGSIATNGAIYSIVFAPKRRMLWVAAGEIPVPENPFTGFNLNELFGDDSAVAPASVE